MSTIEITLKCDHSFGRGLLTVPTNAPTMPREDVLFYKRTEFRPVPPLEWCALDMYAGEYIGSEITLGAELGDRRSSAMIVYAQGSSSLVHHWQPTSPSGPVVGRTLTAAAFDAVRRLIEKLEAQGHIAYVGRVFAPGYENDLTSEYAAKAYGHAARMFRDAVRRAFGRWCQVFFRRTNANQTVLSATHMATVEVALEEIEAESEGVYLFDWSSVPLAEDLVHPTANGYQDLGMIEADAANALGPSPVGPSAIDGFPDDVVIDGPESSPEIPWGALGAVFLGGEWRMRVRCDPMAELQYVVHLGNGEHIRFDPSGTALRAYVFAGGVECALIGSPTTGIQDLDFLVDFRRPASGPRTDNIALRIGDTEIARGSLDRDWTIGLTVSNYATFGSRDFSVAPLVGAGGVLPRIYRPVRGAPP